MGMICTCTEIYRDCVFLNICTNVKNKLKDVEDATSQKLPKGKGKAVMDRF